MRKAVDQPGSREEPKGHEMVLTVGHSNHTIEKLVALLKAHDVTAVADVRSSPFSRFSPHFNRVPLQQALKDNEIAYVFLGAELGARSKDPTCYQHGKVQYDRLAQTDLFKAGLRRVVQGAESYRLVILCAEKEPLACHRTILVARELERLGVHVSHILADGRIETHEAAIRRLFATLQIPHVDFFRTAEDLLSEAYARQAERIAYVDEEASGEAE